MKKRFVVIGASAASIAFITKLRSIDSVSEIICIAGEMHAPYNRCLLADYLSKDIAWDQMQLKPDDFFDHHGVILRLNSWVTKIDTKHNRVFVGLEEISYDYLFLGIGTKPFIPPIGVDTSLDGVFTFHTAQDIDRISAFIDRHPGATMIVVGAGLNGLECAYSLKVRGMQVTVIEKNSQILPAQVDQESAEYIASMMQEKEIGLICGMGVSQLLVDNHAIRGVTLENGDVKSAVGVVFATGSVVHHELLQETGLATLQGSVIIDGSMKTNISNIYAAGDICIVQDSITKQFVKSATWADAMLQGLCAATQFSDRPRFYPGYVGLRDSVFFGYDFYACGQTINFDDSVDMVRKSTSSSMQLFYIKDQKLLGFVLLGDVSKIAQYKQWYMIQRNVVKSDF